MEAKGAVFRNSERMFPHSSLFPLPSHTSPEMMICQNVFSRFAVGVEAAAAAEIHRSPPLTSGALVTDSMTSWYFTKMEKFCACLKIITYATKEEEGFLLLRVALRSLSLSLLSSLFLSVSPPQIL